VSKSPNSQSDERPVEVKGEGRAIPMTVFSPLWPGGKWVQRLIFALAGLGGPPTAIDDLDMIHFARLALITGFPDHGQPPDDLRQPLQLFESNYNGSFAQYIDTFVEKIPWRMRAFWGTSYGFPWCLPLGRFKQYIRANEFAMDYYYVRNPGATVTMIKAARATARANARLRQEAPALDPDAFTERFDKLLTKLQGKL
jgi:hypothetical protein